MMTLADGNYYSTACSQINSEISIKALISKNEISGWPLSDPSVYDNIKKGMSNFLSVRCPQLNEKSFKKFVSDSRATCVSHCRVAAIKNMDKPNDNQNSEVDSACDKVCETLKVNLLYAFIESGERSCNGNPTLETVSGTPPHVIEPLEH